MGLFVTISQLASVAQPHMSRCIARLHCPSPFVWLPLPVELDVVVVATRNRSGTIVTVGKTKIKETDIKFGARHVCRVDIHENMAAGWYQHLGGNKSH